MTYWDLILKEVLNKNTPSATYDFTPRRDDTSGGKRSKGKRKNSAKKRVIKSYPIGEPYPGLFFTQREAQSIFLILRGKTVAKTAIVLGLSVRTVEFYVKKMKNKLNCRTKSELIEKVLQSEFMKNADFPELLKNES